VSQHLITNAEVIRAFLPVEIVIEGQLGQPGVVRVQP
jgi:RNA 3'-terminal phosphate cyclase (ATP)